MELNKVAPLRFLSFLILASILFLTFLSNFEVAKAENNVLIFPNIHVNRIVEFENGGALVINDTFTFSANANQNVTSLELFQIGFPAVYTDNLRYYFAYDSKGKLSMNLNNESWIEVEFPNLIDVSSGGSYNFTIIYVFSKLIEAGENRSFRAVFPLYPILTRKADFCKVTVRLPTGANFTGSSTSFLNSTVDSRIVLFNETCLLEPFRSVSSWVNFTASDFVLLEIEEMRRELRIDAFGELYVADHYEIANFKGDKLSFILPKNATNISLQDIFGAYDQSKMSVTKKEKYTEIDVTLRNAILAENKMDFLIAYEIPFWEYAIHDAWYIYRLNVSLVRPDWILKQFVLVVTLPEGAVYQSSTTPLSLEKSFLSEKLKMLANNVTRFHNLDFDLNYQYTILWVSFRPTLWTGVVIALFGVTFFLVRKPKLEAVAVEPALIELLRKFVETYDERRRLMLDRESLEQRVQRGKISRRQYRLRRSSIDNRLSKLAKDSTELRKRIEAAGGRFAEMMKKLEIAETMLETLDRDIERLEVRYQREEISSEARRRLLEEYNRGKEQAENTIQEIVLRLREEIK
jgi:hypothetical protein